MEQLGESPFAGGDSKRSFRPDGEIFDEIDEITPIGPNGTLEWLENTFYFKEFEDIILLSSRMKGNDVKTSLYSFERYLLFTCTVRYRR